MDSFKLLVQEKLGPNIQIDTGSPRLILVANSYSKYDEYAINRMAENIEMWTYNLYEDLFELRLAASSNSTKKSNGKKITKIDYEEYSIDKILQGKSQEIKDLFVEIQDQLVAIPSDIALEELPRKLYVAYKTNKNIVCLQPQSSDIRAFISLDPFVAQKITPAARDVTNIGHYGTGETELRIKKFDDIADLVVLVKEALKVN